MHCAVRAQPEGTIEPVHKTTTQFLHSDGFRQQPCERQGSLQCPPQLMEKQRFISAGFGSGL